MLVMDQVTREQNSDQGHFYYLQVQSPTVPVTQVSVPEMTGAAATNQELDGAPA